MERLGAAALLVAFVLLSQAEARTVTTPSKTLEVKDTKDVKAKTEVKPQAAKASIAPKVDDKAAAPASKPKVTAMVGFEPKISPPVQGSDKKFFGPPFPANYPDDKRPAVDKYILDKLKGPHQPYPALQSKSDYDSDYVKDENSDRGDWKAQFEYDTLRKKLQQQGYQAGAAGDRADKEGRDVDGAAADAERAGKNVDDARKNLDDARAGDDAAKHDPDDWAGAPSDEKLKKLEAAVADAEKNYAKEQKEFEECKRQLEEAKKILDDLKAKEKEMESQLAAETKLWIDTKSVRLQAKKEKENIAHSKTLSAHERLREAQQRKAEMDTILADKKASHDKALKAAAKEKADVERTKKDLEKATLTLQKLRGYKPAEPAHSSAQSVAALVAFALLASQAF